VVPEYGGGCVTLIAGGSTSTVLNAFGVQPEERPVQWDEAARDGIRGVAAVELPGGAMAVEMMSTEGARDIVLRDVSRSGRAASLYWNPEIGHTLLSLAEHGVMRFSEEAQWAPQVDDPELQRVFAGLEFEENTRVTDGFVAMERFTGVRLGDGAVQPLLVYRLVPRLDDFPSAAAVTEAPRADDEDFYYRPRDWSLAVTAFGEDGAKRLIAAVDRASVQARRRLAALAVCEVLRAVGFENHPDLLATVADLEAVDGATLTPAAELVVRRGLMIPDRGPKPREFSAMKALLYACNPDSVAAALDATWRAGYHLWKAERDAGPKAGQFLTDDEMEGRATGQAAPALLERAFHTLAET
jgi:hypothetical protein